MWRPGLLIASALSLVGCATGFGERPELPTAIPGMMSKQGEAKTPVSQRISATSDQGPTSTPAPWATALPPTPLPKARAVSHNLVGKSDCLYCHKGPTYYRVPADHAVRTNQTCLGCHAPTSSPPRAVPHPKAGREGCLICHLLGKNGARAVPGDHGGRLNDTCATCHLIN